MDIFVYTLTINTNKCSTQDNIICTRCERGEKALPFSKGVTGSWSGKFAMLVE